MSLVNDDDCFILHKSVFTNDLRKIASLLKTHDLGSKDVHGNTPLHLAVMLGHKECIQLLLAHDAPVRVKNNQGWTPLEEAISFGDRQAITSLLRKLRKQSRETMETRRPDLTKALIGMGNFAMELRWDFQSWIPFISRTLPSDVCHIHKKGCNIHLDTTLVDFNDMKWEKGDISFLFNGSAKPSHSLIVMDNNLKVFQRVRYEESEAEIEDEVDILMSSDIVSAQISTKNITFTRSQNGWLFREDRTEMIGSFLSDIYSISGVYLVTRKRREHLTYEDLRKNKALIESFKKGSGNFFSLDNYIDPVSRRKSLLPPVNRNVSWEAYIKAIPGRPPCLGREMMCKKSTKAFKATLAMVCNDQLIQSL